MKDADNARAAQEKNYSEKARALKITFESEKVRCDAKKANIDAQKVKSDAGRT